MAHIRRTYEQFRRLATGFNDAVGVKANICLEGADGVIEFWPGPEIGIFKLPGLSEQFLSSVQIDRVVRSARTDAAL